MNKDILVNQIIAYESDELTEQECLKLFSTLIQNGMVWQLQGHYGRTAQALIDQKIINANGEVQK